MSQWQLVQAHMATPRYEDDGVHCETTADAINRVIAAQQEEFQRVEILLVPTSDGTPEAVVLIGVPE